MELHKQLNTFPAHQQSVLTIGTFDGLHLGHQKILATVCEQAKQKGLVSVLLTFHPHPRRVLFPNEELGLIQTQEEKLERLAALGIDHVVVLEFNENFAKQTAEAFVEDILIKGLHAQSVIIGYDHQFGHDRQGNLSFLRKYEALGSFEVHEIPVEQIDEVYISSSKIRKAIEQGQIAQANAYLGQPYQVSGFVSRGLQNGRSIGFPTANVQLTETEKILPADGVYAVSSEFNGAKLFGMMNIGWRPTIQEAKTERKIEVHFFDFQEDIYEAYLALCLHERIRAEQKFENLEALKMQLKQDEQAVRSYFQN
ncbi:MAG: riboflavin biosynthesis protein RibF [Bacteroidota bacterium]|jgi:riboflavin kinase/FMN adenylyltransferase